MPRLRSSWFVLASSLVIGLIAVLLLPSISVKRGAAEFVTCP